MNNKEFTCAYCKGTFPLDWTEEEAVFEMKATFGEETTVEECDALCDDCYNKVMGKE